MIGALLIAPVAVPCAFKPCGAGIGRVPGALTISSADSPFLFKTCDIGFGRLPEASELAITFGIVGAVGITGPGGATPAVVFFFPKVFGGRILTAR